MTIRRCQRPNSQNAAGVRNRRSAGFTVVELVVTISIAAILTTVAVPSFSGLIASQRAKTVASELFASLLKTRAEAIMRNANVTVSPLAGSVGRHWTPIATSFFVALAATQAYSAISGRDHVASTSFLITTTSGSSTNYQCISLTLSGRPYMQAAQTC